MKASFFARTEVSRISVLSILFIVGFAIRAIGINEIPLGYHPIKQFRSALTARAIYHSFQNDIEYVEKEISQSALDHIGILGPPIVDIVAAGVYLLIGSELLWIPKLLSVLYWLIGGFFLYKIARKLVSEDAAISTCAFYLFLEFGVFSSQSFQPDPLMIMFMIMGIYYQISYFEHPNFINFLLMVILSACAILVKPVSIFIVVVSYVIQSLNNVRSIKSLLIDKNLYIFLALAILPSAIYYGYGILNPGPLYYQAQKSFLPQLLLDINFWDGWLKRIRLSIGFTSFLGGMLSVFLFSSNLKKQLIGSLWIGYFLMCLVFTYTISTHDYYHLPLIPIVALSLGPLFEIIFYTLRKQTVIWYLDLAVWLLLFFALFLSAGSAVQAIRKLPDYSPQVQLAQKVGDLVDHSTKTILLSQYDGKPLMYYAKISGLYWPYWFDIRDEKLWGVNIESAEERFKLIQEQIDPEYFIVTDIEEFQRQKDLMNYLYMKYPIYFQASDFVIFSIK